ncbi:MAG TPA: hypothetical protein VK210_17630, partial [Terriglobia bacterium]|nr:hypothetical protein [Terriglobia bacterium]
NRLERNNPARPELEQAIGALNGAASQALKGVNIDPAALTKAQEAVGNAEVAISRQLEIIVAKDNARSPQEDAAPEGSSKVVAEYYKRLATEKP